jgi:hypothetical protein
MDEYFLQFLIFGESEQCEEMVFVRVHRSGRHESHEMESALVFFTILDGLEEGGIFEEGAVLDGERDAREILIDHATGAESHVPDFAVAGGIPGKTDGDAGCLQGDHRVETAHFIEGGEFSLADRIPLNEIGEPPSVEYDEYHRFVCIHVVFEIFLIFTRSEPSRA